MKLNLGCGTIRMEGYVNVDSQRLPGVDLVWDLRMQLPYEDGTIDEITTWNFIHIFSRRDWRELKKEMARTLKSRGKLEIVLHDVKYVLEAFLSNKAGETWDWWLQCLYGAQKDEYDYIKNAFTFEKLKSDLWEEGFVDFEEIKDDPERIHLICYKQ